MAQTITDQLLKLQAKAVPDAAGAMMALSIFDWMACGLAGAREPEFADFKKQQESLGQGPCTLFGGGQVPAPVAALVNGTLSHALDYDDTHFAHIGHPSVAVLPALLALGQEVGADRESLIEAATVGVEGSILVGLWLGRTHYQVGYHQTATAGAFGATLGACRLLGLEKDQVRAALGLTASMASGLKAQFGTMAKPLNAGLAARTGVEATLWAQAGMTAAEDGLAGPLGFGETHHGEAAQVSLPGKRWRILDISHKFHACCHGLHAMLEALSGVSLEAERIRTIKVRTHPRWLTVCNIAAPRTGLEAKFSYGQTCAMALLGHGTDGIDNFTDEICRDPEVVALRAKVTVEADEALAETQSEVTISLEGGAMRRLRGDLMAPLPLEKRAEKLRAKAAALVGAAAAERLWQALEAEALSALTDQLVMS